MPIYKEQHTAQANTANNMLLTVAPAGDAAIHTIKYKIVPTIKNSIIAVSITNKIFFAIYSKFYAELSAVNILF